jgi:hypothetical protein
VSSSRASGACERTLSPSRQQLAASALGECVGADRVEVVVREPELFARVDPPILAAQPLPVQQASAGKMNRHPPPSEALDRLAIQVVGSVAFGDERP